MVHLEGPVVDSIYDLLLLSWHESFSPPLPCLAEPSPYSPQAEKPFKYLFSDKNPFLEHIDIAKAAAAARRLLTAQNEKAQQEAHAVSTGETDTATPTWWQALLDPERQDPSQHRAAHRPQEGGFAALVQQLVERAREEKQKAFGEGGTGVGGLLRRTTEVPRRGTGYVDRNAVASTAPTEATAVEMTGVASESVFTFCCARSLV